METIRELEAVTVIRMGQQLTQGEKAIAELAHFRQAFGLTPELDLVAEFDRRGEASEQRINELEQQLFKALCTVEAYERSVQPMPVAS